MFSSHKMIAVVSIVIASLLAGACKNKSADANGEAVAKVGSNEITMKQVDSVIKQQIDASGGGSFTPVELVAARLTVLDKLIQEEALYQKAQKENTVPDENKVTQEIQRRKQEAGLSEEQYQNQLKQAGLTEEDLRDKVRRELAITALRDRERARVSAPTDAEIEKYYNDRKDQFVAERGVDISIIVADPANNGITDDAVGDSAAEQKIKAIYEQLKGGADFATVAAQRSEHPSAGRSGNLGFGSEAALRQMFPTRPEIAQQLLGMTAGQYTEPIKDNISGQWVIFKLNGKREQAQNLTLSDPSVRKNVIDLITQQRQEVLLNALVMVAMSETSVENYLAQRIVEDPKRIVEMRPSQLLEQSGAANQQQPRIENENRNQASSPATSNANRAASPSTNGNRPAAASNANR